MRWTSAAALDVVFHGAGTVPRSLGRLAFAQRRVWFEFDSSWLEDPLPISPVALPPKAGLHPGPSEPFGGLHGLFHDSLPDGWGRLLLDREVRRLGHDPGDLTALDRLAWIGDRALGALEYRPAIGLPVTPTVVDLAELATASHVVLADAHTDHLAELLLLGGSPHGARPKVLVGVSPDRQRLAHAHGAVPDGFEPWIVKFHLPGDGPDAGRLEACWARLARRAGLDVPDHHLFETPAGAFFGARRFDRSGGRRHHVQTFAALWHVDFRVPSVDARDLLKATSWLTRDQREVAKVVRWHAFNVLAHNRDDHPKNIAFRLDDAGEWTLTPFYDLTWSDGPGGEHWFTVAGEGRAPTLGHLIEAAEPAGLEAATVRRIGDEVREGFSHFETEAALLGVGPERIQALRASLDVLNARFFAESAPKRPARTRS
ncbi:MAG: type II toxin-antitoxin system HipA family toxin [Myxococcales bacterium]|nr:type II toxin-antitoxin system HipA family toxin [Myxococcales bacterium]